ncbi:MAG TPA: hypothetical protein VGH87_27700, partial [Polyangiaceae bacterium]
MQHRAPSYFGLLLLAAACHDTADASTGAKSDAPIVATATNDAGPATPPGMIWIPAGTLKAGTPKNKAPRIPDEEM